MTPSIDAAKKLATLLDTTVGYLLGENENAVMLAKIFERESLLQSKELPASLRIRFVVGMFLQKLSARLK